MVVVTWKSSRSKNVIYEPVSTLWATRDAVGSLSRLASRFCVVHVHTLGASAQKHNWYFVETSNFNFKSNRWEEQVERVLEKKKYSTGCTKSRMKPCERLGHEGSTKMMMMNCNSLNNHKLIMNKLNFMHNTRYDSHIIRTESSNLSCFLPAEHFGYHKTQRQ